MQIDNVLTNRQLYKKAYLIEFYGDDDTTPEDVFTFSIPPENEDLSYTQRKTETKIFGGLHVDEYGIDAAKIVLSGSTINQSIKRIYRGKDSSKWLSGEDEIYYLRDLIQKYRSLESLQNKSNKSSLGKIIIYDLSKFTGFQATESIIKNYWQAFPGDFKIMRSSDKPFTYKYSFEFTGVPLENEKKEPPIPGGSKTLSVIQEIMSDLKKALDFVNEINAWVDNVLDYVKQVNTLLTVFSNVLSYSTNALTGIIDSAGNTVTGFIDGVTSVVNSTNSIVSLPRTIQLKALNIGLDLQNATNGLMKATDSLAQNCRNMFTREYRDIPQEVLDQYAVNNEEFKDSINNMLNRAENASNEMVVFAKSSDIPDVSVGNPDPETGEPKIVLSYGSTSVTLKSTDSLESLATEYMGNPDSAIDIATFNAVASLSDLKPGDIIRIPITRRTKKSTNNRIFARREDRDNYGRDILLTDDGFIVASNSGDYALTRGARNLSQAILLRLRERVRKRIRLIAYGIRTNIGDPTAGKAYILSSVEQTVSSDPRVSSVDSIRFKGVGDYMDVIVTYSDINNASGNASGRI